MNDIQKDDDRPQDSPEASRRKLIHRIEATGVLALVASGLTAALAPDHDHPRPDVTTTTEAPKNTPEQIAANYQTQALSFAKASANKLSAGKVETNPQGSGDTTYLLSNIPTSELQILRPGEVRKRIVATLRLNQDDSTLELSGVEESIEGTSVAEDPMKNRIAVTLNLDDDNPAVTANPDAPITTSDFIAAINDVEIDDVRSIIVFGRGVKGQMNGEFTPGKPAEYTDGENPITELPSREQVHAVVEAVMGQ